MPKCPTIPYIPPGTPSGPKAEIARIIAQEMAWITASPRKKPGKGKRKG